jgi:hypothetical protein
MEMKQVFRIVSGSQPGEFRIRGAFSFAAPFPLKIIALLTSFSD